MRNCLSRKAVLFLSPTLLLVTSIFAFAQENVSSVERGFTFWELMKAGGWVMGVILALSVVMLGLSFFCFVWIKPARFIPQDIRRMILNQVNGRKFREAFLICDGKPIPYCRTLLFALKQAGVFAQSHLRQETQNFSLEVFYLMENVRRMMESAGMREADRLRSLVIWFSNIGVIAPMLGLLGTVLGMISAFGAIAYKVETGKPILLSSAISQAMVTTAGGLIVGIPSMLLFYHFSNRIAQVLNELEFSAEEVAEALDKALREK